MRAVRVHFRAHSLTPSDNSRFAVGWSTVSPPNNVGFQQNYDQGSGYGNPTDIGMKGRLINLISAVRTVMRSTCHSFPCTQDMENQTSGSTTYRNKRRSHHIRTHTRRIMINTYRGERIVCVSFSMIAQLISIHSTSGTHPRFDPRNL